MQIYRDNLTMYLQMALSVSIKEDIASSYISQGGESIRTAALKHMIDAVSRGETLEYFKE